MHPVIVTKLARQETCDAVLIFERASSPEHFLVLLSVLTTAAQA